MKTAIKILQKLPSYLYFEGIKFKLKFEFDLEIDYFSISYDITEVKESSKHFTSIKKYEGFDNKIIQSFTGFLYYTNFNTLKQLKQIKTELTRIINQYDLENVRNFE